MRITESQIRRIIREEARRVMSEAGSATLSVLQYPLLTNDTQPGLVVVNDLKYVATLTAWQKTMKLQIPPNISQTKFPLDKPVEIMVNATNGNYVKTADVNTIAKYASLNHPVMLSQIMWALSAQTTDKGQREQEQGWINSMKRVLA